MFSVRNIRTVKINKNFSSIGNSVEPVHLFIDLVRDLLSVDVVSIEMTEGRHRRSRNAIRKRKRTAVTADLSTDACAEV